MSDELTQQIKLLDYVNCYRVADVLKKTAHETTEIVYFVGKNGSELGPFIRKRIALNAGIGAEYDRIFAAQKSGQRFRYVPCIFDCIKLDGELVVVMEYFEGVTLLELITTQGPSPDLAYRIFPLLCDGVQELHDGFNPSLIHRDIKPSNIMVSSAGLIIIDFGIARSFKRDAEEDTSHFGTRGYAPPEQFGFGQTDSKSDIYALGMVLYCCLTGCSPVSQLQGNKAAFELVHPAFAKVILKAVDLNPNKRFKSAEELKHSFLACFNHDQNVVQVMVDPTTKRKQREVVVPELIEGNKKQNVFAYLMNFSQRVANRIPLFYGRIWNTILIVLLAFLVLLGFIPVNVERFTAGGFTESQLSLMLEELMAVLAFATWSLVLFDLRALRKKFPILKKFTFLKKIAFVVVTFILYAFLYNLIPGP